MSQQQKQQAPPPMEQDDSSSSSVGCFSCFSSSSSTKRSAGLWTASPERKYVAHTTLAELPKAGEKSRRASQGGESKIIVVEVRGAQEKLLPPPSHDRNGDREGEFTRLETKTEEAQDEKVEEGEAKANGNGVDAKPSEHKSEHKADEGKKQPTPPPVENGSAEKSPNGEHKSSGEKQPEGKMFEQPTTVSQPTEAAPVARQITPPATTTAQPVLVVAAVTRIVPNVVSLPPKLAFVVPAAIDVKDSKLTPPSDPLVDAPVTPVDPNATFVEPFVVSAVQPVSLEKEKDATPQERFLDVWNRAVEGLHGDNTAAEEDSKSPLLEDWIASNGFAPLVSTLRSYASLAAASPASVSIAATTRVTTSSPSPSPYTLHDSSSSEAHLEYFPLPPQASSAAVGAAAGGGFGSSPPATLRWTRREAMRRERESAEIHHEAHIHHHHRQSSQGSGGSGLAPGGGGAALDRAGSLPSEEYHARRGSVSFNAQDDSAHTAASEKQPQLSLALDLSTAQALNAQQQLRDAGAANTGGSSSSVHLTSLPTHTARATLTARRHPDGSLSALGGGGFGGAGGVGGGNEVDPLVFAGVNALAEAAAEKMVLASAAEFDTRAVDHASTRTLSTFSSSAASHSRSLSSSLPIAPISPVEVGRWITELVGMMKQLRGEEKAAVQLADLLAVSPSTTIVLPSDVSTHLANFMSLTVPLIEYYHAPMRSAITEARELLPSNTAGGDAAAVGLLPPREWIVRDCPAAISAALVPSPSVAPALSTLLDGFSLQLLAPPSAWVEHTYRADSSTSLAYAGMLQTMRQIRTVLRWASTDASHSINLPLSSHPLLLHRLLSFSSSTLCSLSASEGDLLSVGVVEEMWEAWFDVVELVERGWRTLCEKAGSMQTEELILLFSSLRNPSSSPSSPSCSPSISSLLLSLASFLFDPLLHPLELRGRVEKTQVEVVNTVGSVVDVLTSASFLRWQASSDPSSSASPLMDLSWFWDGLLPMFVPVFGGAWRAMKECIEDDTGDANNELESSICHFLSRHVFHAPSASQPLICPWLMDDTFTSAYLQLHFSALTSAYHRLSSPGSRAEERAKIHAEVLKRAVMVPSVVQIRQTAPSSAASPSSTPLHTFHLSHLSSTLSHLRVVAWLAGQMDSEEKWRHEKIDGRGVENFERREEVPAVEATEQQKSSRSTSRKQKKKKQHHPEDGDEEEGSGSGSDSDFSDINFEDSDDQFPDHPAAPSLLPAPKLALASSSGSAGGGRHLNELFALGMDGQPLHTQAQVEEEMRIRTEQMQVEEQPEQGGGEEVGEEAKDDEASHSSSDFSDINFEDSDDEYAPHGEAAPAPPALAMAAPKLALGGGGGKHLNELYALGMDGQPLYTEEEVEQAKQAQQAEQEHSSSDLGEDGWGEDDHTPVGTPRQQQKKNKVAGLNMPIAKASDEEEKPVPPAGVTNLTFSSSNHTGGGINRSFSYSSARSSLPLYLSPTLHACLVDLHLHLLLDPLSGGRSLNAMYCTRFPLQAAIEAATRATGTAGTFTRAHLGSTSVEDASVADLQHITSDGATQQHHASEPLARNVLFTLAKHVNHPANAGLCDALLALQSSSADAVDASRAQAHRRLMKLLFEELFTPSAFVHRQQIGRGRFASVYSTDYLEPPASQKSARSTVVLSASEKYALKQVEQPATQHDQVLLVDLFMEISILESLSSSSTGASSSVATGTAQGVLPVLDFGVGEGAFWIVMPLAKSSLKAFKVHHTEVKKEVDEALIQELVKSTAAKQIPSSKLSTLTPQHRRFLACLALYDQALQACARLEEKRVVHFDIKADNFLVFASRSASSSSSSHSSNEKVQGVLQVALADFGEAMFVDSSSSGDSHSSITDPFSSASGSRISRGTENIQSPEMLTLIRALDRSDGKHDRRRKGEADDRSDIWSIGALFYELCMHSFPADGEDSIPGLEGQGLLFEEAAGCPLFLQITSDLLPILREEKSAALSREDLLGPSLLALCSSFLHSVLKRDRLQRPDLHTVRTKFGELVDKAVEEVFKAGQL